MPVHNCRMTTCTLFGDNCAPFLIGFDKLLLCIHQASPPCMCNIQEFYIYIRAPPLSGCPFSFVIIPSLRCEHCMSTIIKSSVICIYNSVTYAFKPMNHFIAGSPSLV